MNWGKFATGTGLVALGAFIASPADEALLAGATGGVTAPAIPLQLPTSAVVGAAMATSGLALIVDSFKKGK